MSDPSTTGATTRAVAALLAPTLGWDKSVELIGGALRRLGLEDEGLGPEDRRAILEDLAHEAGIVGVAARYALSRSRGSSQKMAAVSGPPSSGPASAPSSSAGARLAATLPVHEIVAQLAVMLGQEKAEGTVTAALRRHDLPRERLDREQTVRLLDDLSRQEGLVGVTMRYVRAKILARLGG